MDWNQHLVVLIHLTTVGGHGEADTARRPSEQAEGSRREWTVTSGVSGRQMGGRGVE